MQIASRKQQVKKILIMGRSGAGKTSIRSIIFSDYIAEDTITLLSTDDVHQTHIQFLGNLVLVLCDCGGQEKFMKTYFTDQKERVFQETNVLVYMFDLTSPDLKYDVEQYKQCVENTLFYSPEAIVHCLFNKSDLIEDEVKLNKISDSIITQIENLNLKISLKSHITSIWNESLYTVWSQILPCLVPNIAKFRDVLSELANSVDACDVIMFDRATFLNIAQYSSSGRNSPQKKNISTLMMSLKAYTEMIYNDFTKMVWNGGNVTIFTEAFTESSYIFLALREKFFCEDFIQTNINKAKKLISKLEAESVFI